MAGKGFTAEQELQYTVAVIDRLVKARGREISAGDKKILRDLRAKMTAEADPIEGRQVLADGVLVAIINWGKAEEKTPPVKSRGGEKNGLDVGLYRLGSRYYIVHWNGQGTYKYAEEWVEAEGRWNYQSARADGVMKDLTPRHMLTPPQERDVCRKYPAVNRKLKQVRPASAA